MLDKSGSQYKRKREGNEREVEEGGGGPPPCRNQRRSTAVFADAGEEFVQLAQKIEGEKEGETERICRGNERASSGRLLAREGVGEG
jgi:hypothetical protein